MMVATALVMFLAACSSTKVTSSWKQNDARIQQNDKVMVLALIPNKEGGLRANIEKEMVLALQQKGYNAVSAFETFGPQAFKNLNEERALKKLDRQGVQQVMTVVLLDKSKEKNYVQGSPYGGFYPYYGRFWGYYGYMYNRVYSPGYYTVDTKYYLESNLYDLNTNKVIYSVQTQTFDPSSAQRMAVVYSQKVVKDMAKQQVISKR